MKVLIHTYDTAYQNNAGGVHNRIDRTVKELRKFGIEVDFFDKYRTNIREYDILHIFKLDISSKQLVEYAKSLGIKSVISSIISIDKGRLIDFYWKLRRLPINTIYKWIFKICDYADSVIVETPKESRYMIRHFHVEYKKINILPNGVDSITDIDNSIYNVIGGSRKYVLCLGRFDSNKNQLNAIKALSGTDIDFVLIGGPDSSSIEYYNRCLSEAEKYKNIHFLGWLNSEDQLLKSALGNASIILCPSFQETFGLSIVEGMMAGAIPVLSRTLPILEYSSFRNCLTFNPYDTKDIRDKIEKAISFNRNYEVSNEFKIEFSWEHVARRHIEIYKSLLNI